MEKKTPHILCLLGLAVLPLLAPVKADARPNSPREWFAGVSAGPVLAFGDDSYHVFKDFSDAAGFVLSVNAGTELSKRFGLRGEARFLKAYSRVNTETYETLFPVHPELFPKRGFYGYSVFALQGEAMLYLVNHEFTPGRALYVYVFGGLGFNTAFNYDKVVKNWSSSTGGGWYNVDDSANTMLAIPVGFGLQYRFNKHLGLNFEAACTFTGDRLEGIKYEENYDAYITTTLGLCYYF